MKVLELDNVATLAFALVAIEIGKRINRVVPWLDRNHVPPAVSAGLLLSLVFAMVGIFVAALLL